MGRFHLFGEKNISTVFLIWVQLTFAFQLVAKLFAFALDPLFILYMVDRFVSRGCLLRRTYDIFYS